MVFMGRVTVEELRAAFADTLERAHSKGGIQLVFDEGGTHYRFVGVPYSLDERDGGYLEAGPYAKDPMRPVPSDYLKNIKRFPVDSIVSFERFELSTG